jgi:hypothetical protein
MIVAARRVRCAWLVSLMLAVAACGGPAPAGTDPGRDDPIDDSPAPTNSVPSASAQPGPVGPSTVTVSLGDATYNLSSSNCLLSEPAGFTVFGDSFTRLVAGVRSSTAALTLADGTVWQASDVEFEVAEDRASWSGEMTSAGTSQPATITIEC